MTFPTVQPRDKHVLKHLQACPHIWQQHDDCGSDGMFTNTEEFNLQIMEILLLEFGNLTW